MENDQEAHKAIRSLNGHILNGNRLNVEVSVSCSYVGQKSVSQFLHVCRLLNNRQKRLSVLKL